MRRHAAAMLCMLGLVAAIISTACCFRHHHALHVVATDPELTSGEWKRVIRKLANSDEGVVAAYLRQSLRSAEQALLRDTVRRDFGTYIVQQPFLAQVGDSLELMGPFHPRPQPEVMSLLCGWNLWIELRGKQPCVLHLMDTMLIMGDGAQGPSIRIGVTPACRDKLRGLAGQGVQSHSGVLQGK